MLNSIVLDVAAGLLFTFLAVSLATSTIVEAIASASKLRSRILLTGVKDLVNDPKFNGLARALYGHALVNPRGPDPQGSAADPRKNSPAYIDPQRFADALLDVLQLTTPLKQGTTVGSAQQQVSGNTQVTPQIATLLNGALERGRANYEAVKKDLAGWFDNGMDRLSGAYKRWSQLVSFFVALALCVSLNIDTICIARTLWSSPGIAANVKASVHPENNIDQLIRVFPVGWTNGFFPPYQETTPPGSVPGANAGRYEQAVIGWLITALATLFGAPFWFDALQNLVRLKGAGPSPNEKAGSKAAAA
jgi:hypothetical protein